MQFTANTAALVDALGWVTKSLPARPAAPVLAAVKLSVEGNVLTLSGFDYEQSTVATIEVEGAVDGTVLVSGRLFADIARALPKGEVKVALNATKLLVQAKASKFSLQIMPDTDYPALPAQPTAIGSVDAKEFAEAVRTVVAAAGRDDMLPVLTAVNVQIDPEAGEITLAATDRFRLAVRKVAFQAAPGAQAVEVLVPAKTLDTWAKSLTGEEGTRFGFGAGGANENVFAVVAEGRSATVRVLDGSYPKYQGLIPTTFAAESVFEQTDLLAAVKRVALVADRGTPASVAFSADGITISAASDDEASEDVEAEHSGSDVTMGFNVAFLTDGLVAIGNQQIRVCLVAPNKPVIIQPADDDGYTYLLMPMRGGSS